MPFEAGLQLLLYHCQQFVAVLQNMGTEGAMEWVLGHMEDADFNEPLPDPSASAQSGLASTSAPAAQAPADPESVMMLASMGFSDQQAAAALKVSAVHQSRGSSTIACQPTAYCACCTEHIARRRHSASV